MSQVKHSSFSGPTLAGAAWLSWLLWYATAHGQGNAQAVIQLPIQNIATVNTTVVAPDSGGLGLGGNRNSAAVRNQGFGGGGRGFASANGGGHFDVSVTIHDFESLDEKIAFRLAQRFYDTGKIAEAILKLQELAQPPATPAAQQLAQLGLHQLQVEGSARFTAAVTPLLAQARTLDQHTLLTQYDRLEQVWQSYSGVIHSSERQNLMLALRQMPAIAEARFGSQTMAYLKRGQEAQLKGEIEIAKVWYRLASQYTSTQAGQLAVTLLQALQASQPVAGHQADSKPVTPLAAAQPVPSTPTGTAHSSEQATADILTGLIAAADTAPSTSTSAESKAIAKPTPTPMSPAPTIRSTHESAVQPLSVQLQTEWQLARLYRTSQPALARQRYQRLLLLLPANHPATGEIQQELQALE